MAKSSLNVLECPLLTFGLHPCCTVFYLLITSSFKESYLIAPILSYEFHSQTLFKHLDFEFGVKIWSCGGKEFGCRQGRRRQEALRWWWEVSSQWPAHDCHGLGNVRRLRLRDAHHDLQNRHPSCRQAQPTPKTNHLPNQSAPLRRTSTRHWGAADCLRVRRLNAGLAADSNDGL